MLLSYLPSKLLCGVAREGDSFALRPIPSVPMASVEGASVRFPFLRLAVYARLSRVEALVSTPLLFKLDCLSPSWGHRTPLTT